ncbi:hypothetical protein CHARACLAT_025480 [Characodon lateralis]|uniref:Secreted protein n=1 Tax=Characodon lateralis TaxID=208331 RepID=A0ABU7DJR8_9TELE|nr:hypothetical protein [Characodon lateralis]
MRQFSVLCRSVYAAWIWVLCTVHSPFMCAHMPSSVWVHQTYTNNVLVRTLVHERRPYGMQKVLADDSGTGVLCNKKKQMKNKEEKITVTFIDLLWKLPEQTDSLLAGRINQSKS